MCAKKALALKNQERLLKISIQQYIDTLNGWMHSLSSEMEWLVEVQKFRSSEV